MDKETVIPMSKQGHNKLMRGPVNSVYCIFLSYLLWACYSEADLMQVRILYCMPQMAWTSSNLEHIRWPGIEKRSQKREQIIAI